MYDSYMNLFIVLRLEISDTMLLDVQYILRMIVQGFFRFHSSFESKEIARCLANFYCLIDSLSSLLYNQKSAALFAFLNENFSFVSILD